MMGSHILSSWLRLPSHLWCHLLLLLSLLSFATSECVQDDISDGFGGHFSISAGSFSPHHLTVELCTTACGELQLDFSAVEALVGPATASVCLCDSAMSPTDLTPGVCDLCSEDHCWGVDGNSLIVGSLTDVTHLDLTLSHSSPVELSDTPLLAGVADDPGLLFMVDIGDGSPPAQIPASNSEQSEFSLPLIFTSPGDYVITAGARKPGSSFSRVESRAITVLAPSQIVKLTCPVVAQPNITYYCQVYTSGSNVQVALTGFDPVVEMSTPDLSWIKMGLALPQGSSTPMDLLQTSPSSFRLSSPVTSSSRLHLLVWFGHTTGQCQTQLLRPVCSSASSSVCAASGSCSASCPQLTTLVSTADETTVISRAASCPASQLLCTLSQQCAVDMSSVCSDDASPTTLQLIHVLTLDITAGVADSLTPSDDVIAEPGDVLQVSCTSGVVGSRSVESGGDLDMAGAATIEQHYFQALWLPLEPVSVAQQCHLPVSWTLHSLSLTEDPSVDAVSMRTECQIPPQGLRMVHVENLGVDLLPHVQEVDDPIYISTADPMYVRVAIEQGAPVLFSWDFGTPSVQNFSIDLLQPVDPQAFYSGSVQYPNSGSYLVTCTAANLHSDEPAASPETVQLLVAAQHPVLEDWSLIVHSQGLIESVVQPFEPAEVIIRLQLPEHLQLPTDAVVMADFGDGFAFTAPRPLTEFGLEDSSDTSVAEGGFFFLPLEHMYFSEGVHTVTVSLANQVSNHTMYIEVDVHELVVGLQVFLRFQLDEHTEELEEGLGDDYNEFHNDKNMTFLFEMTQGTATHYLMYNTTFDQMELIGVLNISDKYNPTQGDFYWLFHENQELNVSFVAADEVQRSDPAAATVVITDPLQPVGGIRIIEGFQVTNQGEEKMINITFEAQSLLWLCLVMDFGDGSPEAAYGDEKVCRSMFPDSQFMPEDVENPMILGHTYWVNGLYNTTAFLFNALSMVTDEAVIPIINYPCPRPQLRVLGASDTLELATPYFRSVRITVETDTNLDCDVDLAIEKQWRVLLVNETTGETMEFVPIREELNSWNKSSLLIRSNFLDFGVYRLQYTLTLWEDGTEKPDLPYRATVSSFIQIVRSPLKAIMIAGSVSRLSRGWGQQVVLDPVGNSLDPDDPTDRSFQFEWFCRQISEQLPQNGSDYESYPLQSLPSVGDLAAGKGEGDYGGCVALGPGRLDFHEGFWELSTEILRPYGEDITFELVVILRKDERRAETAVELEMVSGRPPMMSISCNDEKLCSPTMGGVYINPNKRLGLWGGCLDDCYPPLTYQWTVLGVVNGTELVELDDIQQYIVSPPGYPELSLSAALFGNYSHLQKFQLSLLSNNTHSSQKTGSASFFLVINKPPVVESSLCQISRTEGVSLVDTFSFNCQPAHDPEHHEIVQYSFHMRTINSELGIERSKKMPSSRLPVMNMRLPYGQVTIFYDAIDELGSKSTKEVVTINTELPTQDEFNDIMMGKTFLDAVKLGNATELLMIMLAAETIREAAPWAQPGYVTPGMDAADSQAVVSQQNANALMGLTNIPMDSQASLSMASNGMASVLTSSMGSTEASLQIDSRTRSGALDLASTLAGGLEEAGLSTPEEITGIMSDVASAFSAVALNQATIINDLECSSVPPADMRKAVTLDYDGIVGDYGSETQIPDSKTQLACNIRDSVVVQSSGVADAVELSVTSMKKALMKRLVVGEEAIVDGAGGMSMKLKVMENATEAVLEVGGSVGRVELDNFCPTGDCSDSVAVELTQIPTNIRSTSAGSDQLSPDAIVLSMEVGSRDLRPINVSGLQQPIRVVIPRSTAPKVAVNSSTTNCTGCPPQTVLISASQALQDKLIPLVYSQFNIHKPDSIINVEFYPVSETFSRMFVMLGIGLLPTLSRNEFFRMVDDFPTVKSVAEDVNAVGQYEWFISGDLVRNRTGRVFVAVGEWRDSVDVEKMKQAMSSAGNLSSDLIINDTLSWTFSTDYYLKTYTAGCYFYDTERDTWTSNGLRVVSVDSQAVVCESNHLSSFSSGVFVEPNLIDFAYVFANASFTDNITIYMTMIVFGTLMLMLSIWAHWQDKKDYQKLGAHPLSDNKPTDKYLYEIMVFTGHKKDAATNSQVFFVLSGKDDETSARTFGPTNRRFFHKGAQDVFVMSCPGPLGDLQYIRLWHDNSGSGRLASWHVLYIYVRDLQTGFHSNFVVNNWLALDEADGQLERLIAVAGREQLGKFSHLFSHTSQRNLSDGHLWFSVFLRPARSRFSRLQRVASCFALLFLSMMVNAMWYGVLPSQPSSGSLQFGPMTLSPEQILVGILSNLIVFPPSFFIVFLFRKSRLRTKRRSHIDDALDKQSFGNLLMGNRNDESTTEKLPDKSKKKNKFTLPWWCSIIAWILCIICLFGSAFIVWAYGIQFGNEKTSKWLTSLIMSFFSSVLLIQPIKVFLLAMIISSIFKSVNLDDDDSREDELDPHLCEDEEWIRQPAARKKRSDETVEPYNKEILDQLRKERLNEIAMGKVIREIISYAMFLWILILLSYDNRDPYAFYMKRNLENAFIKLGDRTDWKTDLDFSQVRNNTRFWFWARNVLLPELRAQKWYDGVSPPYGLRGFLDDRVNRIVGFALLRQVRSRPDSCAVHPQVTQLFDQCAGFTGLLKEEDGSFCANWTHHGADSDCQRPEYRYTSAESLHNLPIWAQMDVYGGGGYVVELKGRSATLQRRLDQLQAENWFDNMTRAVFVQFSVYNAQVNLFGMVNIYVEQLPGGGLQPAWDIQGLRLIRHQVGFQLLIFVLEVSYVVCICYFTVRELRLLWRQRAAYFTSYWVYSEWAVILLSLSALVVYALRFIATNKILQTFQSTYGNGYVQLQHAQSLDDLFGYMLGLLVFIATIKFSKLLRFNRRIGMLSVTLRQCWSDLTGFFVIFTIVLLSFAITFNLLLMNHLDDFRTIASSGSQCFAMLLNKFNFDGIYQASWLASVVFIVFSVVMSIVFVNLLLTIIIKAFTLIKDDMKGQNNEHELLDFIKGRLLKFVGRGNRRIIPLSQLSRKSRTSSASDVTRVSDPVAALPDKVDRLLHRINKMYLENNIQVDKKPLISK